ncbi:ABC transporter substrate-binding protein [Thermohalobacter berrensis]|uniref:Fe/B12 periplasmic-binding domain-containing protein n=1 Tax=Thermohalobacter berrensis TaxID=99594 RepID=A0A419SV39_9FIRM|nr:cobalamin-binding protein [Thermohalobacter berrensis]RKD29089.1 hypothetical protein BET03_05950 [Thermohalobacter berrensis]
MKNKKILKTITLLMVFVLTFSILSGCIRKKENQNEKISDSNDTEAEVNYPMTVKDDFGNEVKIEKLPMRIISLAPSHTEILFKLGLGDRVVGVTNYCDFPKEAKEKEKIGDLMNINVEKIIELEPDLVIQYGEGKEEINNQIRQAGIALLSYEPESIQEVIDLIKEIGKITGAQRAAELTTIEMTSKRDYIIEKVKDAKKPKVFYEVWDDPLMAAGPGSFIDELITLAGGENIAKDAKGKYPQFSLEKLIERNPQVYLGAKEEGKTVEQIKTREGYEIIDAIKNDRVYLLEPNIISRPGPRIVDGLEIMAKTIHPELFK